MQAPRPRHAWNPTSQACCGLANLKRSAETQQEVDSKVRRATRTQRHATEPQTDFVPETAPDGPPARRLAGTPRVLPCSLVPLSLVPETEYHAHPNWADAEDGISGVLCEPETSNSSYESGSSMSGAGSHGGTSYSETGLDHSAGSMPCSSRHTQLEHHAPAATANLGSQRACGKDVLHNAQSGEQV